jgi:hypothetical protein
MQVAERDENPRHVESGLLSAGLAIGFNGAQRDLTPGPGAEAGERDSGTGPLGEGLEDQVLAVWCQGDLRTRC